MKSVVYFGVFLLLIRCGSQATNDESGKTDSKPPGMVNIPGGEFIMGTDDPDSYSHERPAHRVIVKSFWIDEAEVTNAAFNTFVEATGYVTIAERKPSWEQLSKQVPPGTPKPPDSVLVPGSLIFHSPEEPVILNDYRQWWRWEKGANWKHPEGQGSTIEGRGNHPVVHISYDDALTYAKWKGKRLPTEAEWEFASRGGAVQSRFGWGNDITP